MTPVWTPDLIDLKMEVTAAGLKTAFSMALVAPTPLETVALNVDDIFGTAEEDEAFEWRCLTSGQDPGQVTNTTFVTLIEGS